MCKALELVEGCPCPDGCLACIHDHGCTGYNSASTAQIMAPRESRVCCCRRPFCAQYCEPGRQRLKRAVVGVFCSAFTPFMKDKSRSWKKISLQLPMLPPKIVAMEVLRFYLNPPPARTSLTREMHIDDPPLCPNIAFRAFYVLGNGNEKPTHHPEQIIDKRAALIILRRLIEDMMEAGQGATVARQVFEEKVDAPSSQQRWRRRRRDQADDEDSAQKGGGFFLDRESSEADPDEGIDGNYRKGATSGGDEQLEVDTQQEGGVGDGGVGVGDGLIASPRKRQRLRNLRVAKGMDRARENDIAVVKRWIPSVP